MDVQIVLIISTAFTAVAAVVFVSGQYFESHRRVRRRLPASVGGPEGSGWTFGAAVTEHFTEERYGIDTALKRKLKRQLLRAGFFSPLAIRYYVFARFCAVVGLPGLVFVACKAFAPDLSSILVTVAVSVAAAVGILGPDAYLSRRQSKLVKEYRLIFPDVLDLLTVCVSAGLSVEASFTKMRDHIFRRCPAFARNIELMETEMRAGRSTVEALSLLADRIGLDEAASLVAMLRQSVELGGDIATSLRVYSEMMRTKRMLMAEKKANELPVKIVMPMAFGIFPVILMIVMLPVMLKLIKVMHS